MASSRETSEIEDSEFENSEDEENGLQMEMKFVPGKRDGSRNLVSSDHQIFHRYKGTTE